MRLTTSSASMATRYEVLAQAAGVRLCPDHACSHKGGSEKGVVHWANPNFTHPGALLFLKRAYQATSPGLKHLHHWQDRWDRVRWITDTALMAGVRIPSYLWSVERALMREQISKHKRQQGVALNFDPDLEKFRSAERWAWKDRVIHHGGLTEA